MASCYIDCSSYASQVGSQTQQNVSSAYNDLDSKIDDSEDAYEKYYDSIKEQNKLLEKITKARKYNTMKMKQVNFLLKKIIENKNITIDIEILNAMKKLNTNNNIQGTP